MTDVKSFEEYKKLLASPEAKVIDFWAEWCGPCRAMIPVLEEVAGESPVPIYKVNIDEIPEAAAHHGIRGIPTLLIIKDGNVKEMLVGKQSSERILEKISKL